jgi:hypothetical protein
MPTGGVQHCAMQGAAADCRQDVGCGLWWVRRDA